MNRKSVQFYDFNTRQKDLLLLRVGNFIYLILESVTRRSGPSVPMLCRESMKNYVESLKGIVFSKKTAIVTSQLAKLSFNLNIAAISIRSYVLFVWTETMYQIGHLQDKH